MGGGGGGGGVGGGVWGRGGLRWWAGGEVSDDCHQMQQLLPRDTSGISGSGNNKAILSLCLILNWTEH